MQFDYFGADFQASKVWVYEGIQKIVTNKANVAKLKNTIFYSGQAVSAETVADQLKDELCFLEPESFKVNLFSNSAYAKNITFKGWQTNIITQYSKVAQFFGNFFSKNSEKIRHNRSKITNWSMLNRVKYALFSPLGGSREVGASAYMLETDQYDFLIDYGLGFIKNKTPFTQYINFNKLKGIFITHGHTDHTALIPYLYKKGYKGPLYCTQGTLYSFYSSCKDYLKITTEPLYADNDLQHALLNVVLIKNNSVVVDSENLQISAYDAGHIVGSSMYVFNLKNQVRNVKILFTGDYRTKQISQIMPAPFNFKNSIDVVITESTYGAQTRLEVLTEREEELISLIKNTVERGSHVLIPTISNRSGEIAVEFINLLTQYAPNLLPYLNLTSPVLQSVNMYKDCEKQLARSWTSYCNYFEKALNQPASPLITIAPPGMLEGGESLTIFKRYRNDENSVVIITNFCAQSTIGRALIDTPQNIPILDKNGAAINLSTRNKICVLKCFSGHVNGEDNMKYLKNTVKKFNKVILVHGSIEKISALKKYLRTMEFKHVYNICELEKIRLF